MTLKSYQKIMPQTIKSDRWLTGEFTNRLLYIAGNIIAVQSDFLGWILVRFVFRFRFVGINESDGGVR